MVGVAVTAHTRIKSKQHTHCMLAQELCKNIEGDVGKGEASSHDLLVVRFARHPGIAVHNSNSKFRAIPTRIKTYPAP